MSKSFIILDIITAVLWGFNCGYAVSKRNAAGFVHGAYAIVFAGLAIAGIVSM